MCVLLNVFKVVPHCISLSFSLIDGLSFLDASLPHFQTHFVFEEVIMSAEGHEGCKKKACETCLIGMPLLAKYRAQLEHDPNECI
jgi:hypothetical protein